jgi:hypothetical protein
LFNVFIERARSTDPGAAAQLANAIAVRYGIAAAEVERRLSVGRFRVKGNVDKATADSFAADLTRLGAIVTVSPVEVAAPAAPPVAPVSLQQPRVPAPAPKPPTVPPQFSSGLAAAAAHDVGEPGLGALSGEFPLTLSTLDGADDVRPASGGFAPPAASDDIDVSMDDDDEEEDLAAMLPASIGPAASVAALGDAPRRPSTIPPPSDIFAPPEAQPDLQLALEVEESPRARKRTEPPPPAMAAHVAAASSAAVEDGYGHGHGQTAARPGEPGWKSQLRDARVQYIAGIVLCAALAMIPAMVIASIREGSAFAELDGKLEERESQVLTRADWDNLDRIRASFAQRKRAERQSIAVTSLLIWAACAGGLAYVWFRVVDWDRVLGPEPRSAP